MDALISFTAICCLWAAPINDDELVSLEPGTLRPYHEINADVRAFLRRESLAETKENQIAAVLDLCALYEQMKRDPRLVDSPALQSYRIKVWKRLIDVKQDTEKHMARAERLRRRNRDDFDLELVQKADQATLRMAGQMSLIGATYGGPARIFSQAQGAYGGGLLGDYGPDLVELIQRTISPEFWDVVGGPGSIMYYRPLLAIVVRATSEVHHQVGGAMDALRRAGGR